MYFWIWLRHKSVMALYWWRAESNWGLVPWWFVEGIDGIALRILIGVWEWLETKISRNGERIPPRLLSESPSNTISPDQTH